jgi:pimeloyl-ACP methyl ester carboxylesterase
MIFAATHPERTSALVLGNTVARYANAEDYPEEATPEAVEQIVAMFRATWGTEQLIAAVFPSMASDPAFLRWRAKFTRASATPRTAAAQYRYIFGMDVRSVLSTIARPTLKRSLTSWPRIRGLKRQIPTSPSAIIVRPRRQQITTSLSAINARCGTR